MGVIDELEITLVAVLFGLADDLRKAGHIVHTLDLFAGHIFNDLAQGMKFVNGLGVAEAMMRGEQAVQTLPRDLVYAGFALGVLPAQKPAQTRFGARGALFVSSCTPVAAFGLAWPPHLPVPIYAIEADPIFVGDGDSEAARDLIAQAVYGELLLYPGNQHLFMDSSLPVYDAGATALLLSRVLAFLAAIEHAVCANSATAKRTNHSIRSKISIFCYNICVAKGATWWSSHYVLQRRWVCDRNDQAIKQ
ncbi:dienelactone hydrolase family protein [Chloroflexus sp.]|uniref:dienelactone hydrolase family protein n=1 Tax=Chloroflexus sp. TaxID=1904827 RepID=UPI002ACE9878|nr:dienelactone hydrolase family protein [Chloroflexus sp.]